jgi:class 3 adenylate cyclase/tetratricopeptide (TPR) repeat protein
MFCDLVGSTGLSARLDPEDMRDLVSAYRKTITDAVSRFGGFVAQYLGDGVLVYFGYPQAHEDDAERAVRAGLAVVAAVDDIKTRASEQLRARVGIATGLVVVGERIEAGGLWLRDAIGETPNLAARLQAVAVPGEIVIAASTRRLVGRFFECHALGAIELKGLPQPVEAWRVRDRSAGVSRFEAMRTGALSPLVGRQEEIELLLRRWHQAKSGEGRVVLLTGEPGIGKSRIAESLLARLESEPHIHLRYFCSAHHEHSALYPFIAQLERTVGLEPGSSPGAKLDRLEGLLGPTAGDAPQELALIAELLSVPTDGRYPALTMSPAQKREMTLTALLHQLDGVTVQKPILILFEDVHWIDPTSLDLLDRAVSRVADLPALLVITFRPEFQAPWIGQPHVMMLHLSRVDRRDGVGIIAGITESKVLPDAVVEQILDRADGVPLYIEELTRTLLEIGLMRETRDRYELDGPLPPLTIPTTLQDSLVARLDRLGSVKDVVQIAATIGREFSHELIAAVAAITPQDLDAALGQLTSSGLISRRGAPPEATYTFKHVLVQDAAYGTLLKSRRQQLHARIAKLAVERFTAMAEGLPEVVARHLTEAGLASEAIGYWRTAGQRASARWSNREAAVFFNQALSAIESLPENRHNLEQAFEIRLELRTVFNVLGDFRQMLDQLGEAETLAERLNDDRRRGRICAFRTNAHSNLGELDEAVASGTRALEIARGLADLRLRILATSYLIQAHAVRTDYERVVDLATDNLAVLPPEWLGESFGRPDPVSVFDRFYLVTSLAKLGRFAEAAEHEAESMRLTQTVEGGGLPYFAAGMFHLVKGDWAKARSLIERVIGMWAGSVMMLPDAVAASAWVLAQIGDTSEALTRLRDGEQLLEHKSARGSVSARGGAYCWLGRASLLLGLPHEAQRLGECAVSSSPRQPGYAAHALHLLGDIATHLDRIDAERAEANYHQALAIAEPRGMRPLVAHCHRGLAKLYGGTNRSEQAREHFACAMSMYREMNMTFWLKQEEADMRELGSERRTIHSLPHPFLST